MAAEEADLTHPRRRDSFRRVSGEVMRRIGVLAFVVAMAAGGSAAAEPAQPSEAAQAMVGAWEISNVERDRRCAVTFSIEPAPGGFKVDLEPECAIAFPTLTDVVAWTFLKAALRLLDGKGAPVLEFTEVENGLFESERRADGLLFLQTQAALKAETRTPEQLVGDWVLLRELDKPLCRITLSNTPGEGDTFRIVIKAGCAKAILAFGPATWRLDRDQLVLNGKAGMWRFAEAEPTTWERVPLTAEPLLLVRQ
jgi:hypothetical protein